VTLDSLEFEPSLTNRQKLSLTFQNVEAVRFQDVRATEVVQVSRERGHGVHTGKKKYVENKGHEVIQIRDRGQGRGGQTGEMS
jgi:hypothetical protein